MRRFRRKRSSPVREASPATFEAPLPSPSPQTPTVPSPRDGISHQGDWALEAVFPDSASTSIRHIPCPDKECREDDSILGAEYIRYADDDSSDAEVATPTEVSYAPSWTFETVPVGPLGYRQSRTYTAIGQHTCDISGRRWASEKATDGKEKADEEARVVSSAPLSTHETHIDEAADKTFDTRPSLCLCHCASDSKQLPKEGLGARQKRRAESLQPGSKTTPRSKPVPSPTLANVTDEPSVVHTHVAKQAPALSSAMRRREGEKLHYNKLCLSFLRNIALFKSAGSEYKTGMQKNNSADDKAEGETKKVSIPYSQMYANDASKALYGKVSATKTGETKPKRMRGLCFCCMKGEKKEKCPESAAGKKGDDKDKSGKDGKKDGEKKKEDGKKENEKKDKEEKENEKKDREEEEKEIEENQDSSGDAEESSVDEDDEEEDDDDDD